MTSEELTRKINAGYEQAVREARRDERADAEQQAHRRRTMKLHNTMTPDEEDALNKHLGEQERRSVQRVVGVRRVYEIICLEPKGFSTRTVPNIRQAMCQVEMLLETGATKIGIYALKVEAHSNDKLRHGANDQNA